MESVLCALLFTKNSTYTLLNIEFLKQSLEVVIMIVIPTLQRRLSLRIAFTKTQSWSKFSWKTHKWRYIYVESCLTPEPLPPSTKL